MLEQLWEQCRALGLQLPQRPVTPAAICRARAKVDEQVFLRIHRAVLAECPPDTPHSLWRGHRTFAVDGSKLNLPRPLLESGYRTPAQVRQIVTWKFRKSLRQNALHGDPRPTWHYIL